MTPMSRSEARAAGLTWYFTGKPCKRGHVAKRYVSDWSCTACQSIKARAMWRDNPTGRVIHNKRVHLRARSNPQNQLAQRLYNRINKAIDRGQRAGSAVRDLGCTISEFQTYIAAQFQPGMSWGNHGEWHLDHKRPLASFDLTDRDQFLHACHSTNYQPLWAADNLAKGAQYA